jgi:hypothetical protein
MVLAITVVSTTFAGQVLAGSMLVPPVAASSPSHDPTAGSGAITLQADQVVFKAYGLTDGLNWSVKLDRMTESSNVTLVGSTPVGILTFFDVAPGLHNYSVGPVTGYGATPFFGTFTTNGNYYAQTIAFRASHTTYAVEFTATGLDPGADWGVTLTGQTTTSPDSPIVFPRENGTWGYSIIAPSGETASPAQGNATVNGGGMTISIAFSATPTGGSGGSSMGGSSKLVEIAIGGAGILVGIVLGVAILLRTRQSHKPKPPAGAILKRAGPDRSSRATMRPLDQEV